MNGVDRSDQIIRKNTALRKCMRWWKTLFFNMIDIAVVNGFILFQLHRANNPDVEELKRPQQYSTTEFREELVLLSRQGGLFLFQYNYDVNQISIPVTFYQEILAWWSNLRESEDPDNIHKFIIWNDKEK